MKRFKRAAWSLMVLMALGTVSLPSHARMTDDQVVAYVQSQIALGKSEQQIGKELLAKGVTQEQVKRLKEKFDNGEIGQAATPTMPGTQLATSAPALRASNSISALDEIAIVTDQPAADAVKRSGRKIYGQDVFTSSSLSFEPNENQATPQNYRLGPGDEVVIDIWGASEDHLRSVITPEGSIMIEQLGPVFLNGLTINEANARLRDLFAKKYAGVEEQETDVNLTLGQIRTIQVDVLGEVAVKGTYRLSPFSTVFNALYRAGGINDIGTLRNIEVMRNGKRVAKVDVYDFLFSGKTANNIRLQEGDVIIVPPYETMVNLEGNVKRPMYYEVKANESLGDIIKYAGGFTGDAYSDVVRLTRQTGQENELFNVKSDEFDTYRLKDGDVVTVGTVVDRFTNRVQLRGPVMRPGSYAISSDLATLGQLVNKAEGLLENAYTDRVLIYREGPDKSLQILPVDLGAILAGSVPDIKLQKNDIIEIADVQEIFDKGPLTIQGQVASPGEYPFAANTSVEDLILQAGGLLQGASTARIDVSRRMIDPASMKPTNQIAQIFNFTYKGGKVVGKTPDFELMPYDIVVVRKSPGYMPQQRVSINGEVAFEGSYTIESRNERLSSLVERAGGVNEGAYIRGAHLLRKLTEDEKASRDETLRLARMMQDSSDGADSISISKMQVSDYYSVGIELDKALENPGSDYDLVIKEGDQLYIPILINTVRIHGDVLYPNTVVYKTGKKLKYYIDQAGGYGSRAKKSNVYVVYSNGTVAKGKRNTPIEPGCHIIVPSKAPGKGINWAAVMSIATAAGALGTMSAAIANLVK